MSPEFHSGPRVVSNLFLPDRSDGQRRSDRIDCGWAALSGSCFCSDHDLATDCFVFPIRNTLLGDLMKPGIRFFRYVFDLMNDRYLQIQLTGTIMEKNLREPLVRMNRGKAPVQIMDEELQEEVFDKLNKKKPNADYGILTDYYEIFGEMEEYVL